LRLLDETIVVVCGIDVVDDVEFKAIDIFVMLLLAIVVIIEVALGSVVVAHPETNDLFNI
jgi:hypothetical protein